VLDPETGVGAYQISGGASGGALNLSEAFNSNLFWTLSGYDLLAFLTSFLDTIWGAALSTLGAYSSLDLIYNGDCKFSDNMERYLAVTLVFTFLFVALMSLVVAMPLFFSIGFSIIGLLFAESVDASC
jgi:hypothetical protein